MIASETAQAKFRDGSVPSTCAGRICGKTQRHEEGRLRGESSNRKIECLTPASQNNSSLVTPSSPASVVYLFSRIVSGPAGCFKSKNVMRTRCLRGRTVRKGCRRVMLNPARSRKPNTRMAMANPESNKLESNQKVVRHSVEAECSSDWRPRHAASLSNVRP